MKKISIALMTVVFLTAGAAQAAQDSGFVESDRCASCNMQIVKYPGPKGLLVTETDEVLKFCSARGTACGYHDALKKGKVKLVRMHDAAKTDWKAPSDDVLIDARDAWFVYGSSVKAVMGPSLAPFASREDAEKFQKENGGKLLRFDELTPQELGCKEKY